MYDIKTLNVKDGVWINFNNLPTYFEEKLKNLDETTNTEKNDNTYGWEIKTPYGKDCRLLAWRIP